MISGRSLRFLKATESPVEPGCTRRSSPGILKLGISHDDWSRFGVRLIISQIKDLQSQIDALSVLDSINLSVDCNSAESLGDAVLTFSNQLNIELSGVCSENLVMLSSILVLSRLYSCTQYRLMFL